MRSRSSPRSPATSTHPASASASVSVFAPATPTNRCIDSTLLRRALLNVHGFRGLWDLVDPDALARLVAQVRSVPPQEVASEDLLQELESLLDDAEMPTILRIAIAQLLAQSGAAMTEHLLRSRHAEIRTAAIILTAASR